MPHAVISIGEDEVEDVIDRMREILEDFEFVDFSDSENLFLLANALAHMNLVVRGGEDRGDG